MDCSRYLVQTDFYPYDPVYSSLLPTLRRIAAAIESLRYYISRGKAASYISLAEGPLLPENPSDHRLHRVRPVACLFPPARGELFFSSDEADDPNPVIPGREHLPESLWLRSSRIGAGCNNLGLARGHLAGQDPLRAPQCSVEENLEDDSRRRFRNASCGLLARLDGFGHQETLPSSTHETDMAAQLVKVLK